MASEKVFDDVLAANDSYARSFSGAGLKARAASGLAIVTCMDSRIEPLAMLGLRPGDAKILRNAGARVTDDVVRTLVLATHLLGVSRAMVIAHTDCRMAVGSEDEIHRAIQDAGGPDTSELRFLIAPDQRQALRDDVERLRSSPYLSQLKVGGFVYDVASGRIQAVD